MRFSAKTQMNALFQDLHAHGFGGLDIDGRYDIAAKDEFDRQTHAYACLELDVVEPDESASCEYTEFDCGKFFRDLFDHAANVFREGRRAKVWLVVGSGYPKLPVGAHVLQCSVRHSWSFSIEYFTMTLKMRKGALRDLREKKNRYNRPRVMGTGS